MRTIVYVDGFNLYYRLLKRNRANRWLDLEAFVRAKLSPHADLIAIKYYTTRTSGQIDPDAPRKQHLYLKALTSSNLISTYFGNFQTREQWATLVHPPEFRPEVDFEEPYPTVVRISRTEEKGSDVNLGAHLVQDAYLDRYDEALILTNDTDLLEPMRIVIQDVGKPVGLLTPVRKPSDPLKACASFVKHVKQADAAKAQFPDQVTAANGDIVERPAEWHDDDE